MPFDLTRWQSQVRAWWAEHGPRLRAAPVESAYALLAVSAWLPLLAAYAQDPGPATTALVTITAGIGPNLVANLVQRAHDRAHAGEQVAAQARENAGTRAELDAVLQATQALEAAQEALGEHWDHFARQLAQELAALPGRSSLAVTLGDGTVVSGSLVAGDLTMTGSTFVGRDHVAIQGDGNVAGDGSASTVIKTGDHSPVTFVEGVLGRDEAHQQERALCAYLERLVAECNVLHLRGMDPRAADATRQETMSLASVYTALDTNRRKDLLEGFQDFPGDEESANAAEEPATPGEMRFGHHHPRPRDRRLRCTPRQTPGAMRSWHHLPRPIIIGGMPDRPMSALEAASRLDRLVLLGDPGAGKSTFVNHLTLRLAQAALNPQHRRGQVVLGAGNEVEELPGWTRGPCVPLRVILRDLAGSARPGEHGSATALWRFVERALAEADLAAAAPALKARLDGQAVLLLDGLDEVEPGARPWVLGAVADFALTHRRTPILITCRVYAYLEPRWRLAGFEEATLAPLGEEKIDHFIGAWYAEVARLGLMPVAESEERAARLREAVRRLDLRALAPNPLLLTMMALLHSSWGRLPQDRVQLYHEIVELLLARWEESRLGQEALARAGLAPRSLRFALEEVAYAAHASQPTGEGAADVAEALLRGVLQGYLEGDWNRAGDVLRYVRERAGLLLERKPGIYGFPHRTLQEYLAGCHLSVQTDFPTRAADLLQKDETRWREPFLLAVGKTSRVENRVDLALAAVDNLCPHDCDRSPVDEKAWRCAWLAGEALVEVGADTLMRREAWHARLERVAGWLAQLLEAGALAPVERTAAGRVLGQLGDPRDLDEMVFVPGGPFTMGSSQRDKEAYEDERPQHAVEVADYWIGRYPVTNGQYKRFVEARGYDERRYWTRAGWAWRSGIDDSKKPEWVPDWLKYRPLEKRDRPFWWDDPAWNLPNLPVVGVSWFEALAYTRWLSEATRRSCRLPTEAEWEKAARGTDGRIYPWGNEKITPERANYRETGIGSTSPVGCFPSSASLYGCMDMVGNVWEWCSSVGYTESKYPYLADDRREDLERDAVRALRGGSWYYFRENARCASRSDSNPDTSDVFVGFRVALSGPPLSEGR